VHGFTRLAHRLAPVAGTALLAAACGSSNETVTTVAPGSSPPGPSSAMAGITMSSGQLDVLHGELARLENCHGPASCWPQGHVNATIHVTHTRH
jgi:hypothetical protein